MNFFCRLVRFRGMTPPILSCQARQRNREPCRRNSARSREQKLLRIREGIVDPVPQYCGTAGADVRTQISDGLQIRLIEASEVAKNLAPCAPSQDGAPSQRADLALPWTPVPRALLYIRGYEGTRNLSLLIP